MPFASGAVLGLAVLTGVALQLLSNARMADRVDALERLVTAQQRQIAAPETATKPPPRELPSVAAASPVPARPARPETFPVPTPPAAELSPPPIANIAPEEKPVALPAVEASPASELSVSQRESLRRKLLPVLSDQFGPLVAKLQLGVGEEIAFYDALVDERVARSGGTSAQQPTEERLRATLGDAGFAAYVAHREGVGVRALVVDFQKKLAGSAAPIDDGQAEMLFNVISEERERHAALDAQDPEMPKSIDGLRGQPPVVIEKFVASQIALVEAIETRAGEVVTPEQAAVLGEMARGQVETLKKRVAAGQ